LASKESPAGLDWKQGPGFILIIIKSGVFIVIDANTEVSALVPWSVRDLYESLAVEYKACLPTIFGEPPRAIKHPAVVGLDCHRAPLTVVGEVLDYSRVRDNIGKEFNVR